MPEASEGAYFLDCSQAVELIECAEGIAPGQQSHGLPITGIPLPADLGQPEHWHARIPLEAPQCIACLD